MRCRHKEKGNKVNIEPKADVFGCMWLRTAKGSDLQVRLRHLAGDGLLDIPKPIQDKG